MLIDHKAMARTIMIVSFGKFSAFVIYYQADVKCAEQ